MKTPAQTASKTYVLIHGGGGSAFDWHLVESELQDRGHGTIAVDLPMSDPEAGLWDYADAFAQEVGKQVEKAPVPPAGGRRPLVVVAHSWGGFVGPLVAARVGPAALVLLTAMIPKPGETPGEWWERSGWVSPRIEDDYELYMHDVPRELAQRVLDHDGALAAKMSMDRANDEPWPLPAWPDVPTRYLLCRDDRFFTPEFVRRHVEDRLGVTPDEMPGGHMAMLSHPAVLADYLIRLP